MNNVQALAIKHGKMYKTSGIGRSGELFITFILFRCSCDQNNYRVERYTHLLCQWLLTGLALLTLRVIVDVVGDPR